MMKYIFIAALVLSGSALAIELQVTRQAMTVDGLPASTTETNAIEKIVSQGKNGTWIVNRNNMTVKISGYPDDPVVVPDPIPEPNEPVVVPDPIPDPEPEPEPEDPPVISPLGIVLPKIEDIGKPITYQPVGIRTLIDGVYLPNSIRIDGGGGDREEIGLFTEWQSWYLATGSDEALALIIEQADSALDVPWCDYTAMTLQFYYDGKYGYGVSHQPNLFFLPYLLTKDAKYIAPMECQMALYRQKVNGPLQDGSMRWMTPRDLAWNLRTLGQLAYAQAKGDTEQTTYIDTLNKTRDHFVGVINDATDETYLERAFNVIGECKLGNCNYIHGWMEGYAGIVVNYLIQLGFDGWREVAEFQYQNLANRCGGKWPLIACDNGMINFGTNAEYQSIDPRPSWETTAYYPQKYMDCLADLPQDELIPVNRMKCGNEFITYQDRAMVARTWAAMAAINNIPGAKTLYQTIDDSMQKRGDTLKLYKWSILPTSEGAPDPTPDPDPIPDPVDPDPIEPVSDLSTAEPMAWTPIADSTLWNFLLAESPESFTQPIHYIVGPRAIIDAWNGAVFNTKLQRLDIFASGGHGDYCGNEYVGFSLNTLKWELIHGPTRS